MKRYDQWVKLGKPADIMEELALSISTPMKLKPSAIEPQQDEQASQSNTTAKDVISSTPISSTPISTSTSVPGPDIQAKDKDTSSTCKCETCKEIGPKPPPFPGKVWVAAWALQDPPQRALNTSCASTNKSFEELLLDKIKGPQEKAPVKRRKIDRKTKVITNQQYLDHLKRYDEEAKQKTLKKAKPAARKKRGVVNKRIEFNDTDESDEELEQDDKNIDENDEVEEDEEIAEESETSEDECKVMMKYDEDKRKHENGESAVNKSIKKGDREGDNLVKLWKSMDPPTSENDLTQKWFGCIFVAKKKSHLYVGKVMRRFLKKKVDQQNT